MNLLTRLHWQIPALLIGSWLCGLWLAIGHHIFYSVLDGTHVGSSSTQTWSTRIGTGFALVASTLFATSITTACTQILWHRLRSRSVQLQTLDSLFGVFSQPTDLLHVQAWSVAPHVLVFAALAW